MPWSDMVYCAKALNFQYSTALITSQLLHCRSQFSQLKQMEMWQMPDINMMCPVTMKTKSVSTFLSSPLWWPRAGTQYSLLMWKNAKTCLAVKGCESMEWPYSIHGSAMRGAFVFHINMPAVKNKHNNAWISYAFIRWEGLFQCYNLWFQDYFSDAFIIWYKYKNPVYLRASTSL